MDSVKSSFTTGGDFAWKRPVRGPAKALPALVLVWGLVLGLSLGGNPARAESGAAAPSRESVFQVDRLLLDGLVAEVRVRIGQGDRTRLRIEADTAEAAEAIVAEQQGRALRLASRALPDSQSYGTGSDGLTVISGSQIINRAEPGSSSTLIIGGQAVPTRTLPRLILSVPKRLDVEVRDFHGELQAEALTGVLVLDSGGVGRLNFAGLGGVQGRMRGSVRLQVAEMRGDVDLELEGTARVRITAGSLPRLRLRLDGASRFVSEAAVGVADLRVAGAARIELAEVAEIRRQEREGAGRIRIGGT